MILFRVGLLHSTIRKNNIVRRIIYAINEGIKIKNWVILYYTNKTSLKLIDSCLKIVLANNKLKNMKVDLVSILELSVAWSKLLKNYMKQKIRRIGNTKNSHITC